MHLVEHKFVAVVVNLAQLRLQLVKVDGGIVSVLLLLLLFKGILPLLLCVFDASLTRFSGGWLIAIHHAISSQGGSPLRGCFLLLPS